MTSKCVFTLRRKLLPLPGSSVGERYRVGEGGLTEDYVFFILILPAGGNRLTLKVLTGLDKKLTLELLKAVCLLVSLPVFRLAPITDVSTVFSGVSLGSY